MPKLMERVLGIPDTSSYVVESSAIQYDATDLVCTDAFDQLTGSFCYSFQTTISPSTLGGGCKVNTAAELVTVTLEEGGFAGAIGGVVDIDGQDATTNSPTSAPTPGGTTALSDMSMSLSVQMLKSRGATSKQRKAVVAAALTDLAEQYLGRRLQTTRTKPKLNQIQRNNSNKKYEYE